MQTTKRRDVWTCPLETLRMKPAPETKARAALHRELHAERTAADVWGVSPEAMQIAVVLALAPLDVQVMIGRLGFTRALAVCTYARAVGLDPVRLAGIATEKAA